jgi:hypothetical protein
MAHTVSRQGFRKAKKSYTLSPESVTFLDTLRRKQHAVSASSVLEQILQDVRRGTERRAIENAVSDYYATCTVEERDEEARWGDFALGEFPKDL